MFQVITGKTKTETLTFNGILQHGLYYHS